MIRYLSILLLLLSAVVSTAQSRKVNYHPCFLKDSVDTRLTFIRQNAGRVFIDSFDCKDALLDSIASCFIRTKEVKYLDVLTAIGQNPSAKVDGLFTDVVKLFAEDDFIGFVNQLYQAKGKYLPLQNELIAAMNMIVNGRPLKQKYMGLLNVEIERTKDTNDKYRQGYLEKLKSKIEGEQYH